MILDAQAITTTDVDSLVVAVDSVEAGREDQHVKLVLHAVGGANPLAGDFFDGVGLDVHQRNIFAVERSVVTAIA
ncbi:hypothetical protein D3C78_1584270 [compost metagenome]